MSGGVGGRGLATPSYPIGQSTFGYAYTIVVQTATI